MIKLEDLKKELEEHWKRTEKERKRTHSGILYEKFLKKQKKLM
ncbi:hypothetical protein LCGC14_1594800 [marine sediment metagenome]|uniref:Uncharacterized protein n=1 Tax=marine sediment metagenome TaxID=412755 RepID=A0A0F9ICY3_9ZZZZ